MAEKTDSSVKALLSEHAKILHEHGPGSPQEERFVQKHASAREFVKLAQVARALKRSRAKLAS